MLLYVVTMLGRTNSAPWYVWRFCHEPVRHAKKSQLKEPWETGKDRIMHSVTPASSDGQVQVLKLQYFRTYYMKHSLSWEANGSSKFPAFYGTRRFITSSTSARHLSLTLSKIDPAHASASHLLKTPFNIILPPTPVFQIVSFPQVSPPKRCINLSCLPHVLHASPISFYLIWSPKYLVRHTEHKAPRYCSLLHSPVTSPFLGPNIFLSILQYKKSNIQSFPQIILSPASISINNAAEITQRGFMWIIWTGMKLYVTWKMKVPCELSLWLTQP
jgi:hypothetical protein